MSYCMYDFKSEFLTGSMSITYILDVEISHICSICHHMVYVFQYAKQFDVCIVNCQNTKSKINILKKKGVEYSITMCVEFLVLFICHRKDLLFL